MIYILTGNIRSGKTTTLLNWSKNRKDVDGLLCPDNSNGKRYFQKLKTQEKFQLEMEDSDKDNLISVGKFRFLKSAFENANQYLIACSKENPNYLVFDELGKLELKNQGLHEAAKVLVKNHESTSISHLILVVRTSLVEQILKHYNIQNYELISIDDLREKSFA